LSKLIREAVHPSVRGDYVKIASITNEVMGIYLVGFFILEKKLTEVVIRVIGVSETNPHGESPPRVKIQ
jgi:hypothetical protein